MTVTSSSAVNYHTNALPQQAKRSGTNGTPNTTQPESIKLPQNNGVNITVLNPITNVSTSGESTSLVPSTIDSFTLQPASLTPQDLGPMQPFVPPVGGSISAPPPPPPPATANGFGSQQPLYF
jgi:hypothetical protein